MTARSDFAAVLARQRREMDAERAAFAERAVAAVRAQSGGDTFDAFAYRRSMIAIDALLGEFYAAHNGDMGGRFGRLILRQCRAARAMAWGRAMAGARRKLRRQPDLLAAIRREAA